jgi:hypothetical protein
MFGSITASNDSKKSVVVPIIRIVVAVSYAQVVSIVVSRLAPQHPVFFNLMPRDTRSRPSQLALSATSTTCSTNPLPQAITISPVSMYQPTLD